MVLQEVEVSQIIKCSFVPYICCATRMEEGPKVTLDIQCLWQGGEVALTLKITISSTEEVVAAHGL